MPVRPNELYTLETVVPSLARTASGDSGLLEGYGPTSTLRAQLSISAVAGTSPTLSVIAEDTLDNGATWNQIGAFTANKNAAGNEVINITGPYSDQIRFSWTVGGTAPSFTFSVRLFSQAPGV